MSLSLCLGVKIPLKTKKRRSNGDRIGQKRRYRRRIKHGIPKTQKLYFTIDGNFTNHPLAYCTYHHGVVTQGLMDTHKCVERLCPRLRIGDVYE